MNSVEDRKAAAVKLITIYTGGHPRRVFWSLTGNSKRSCRKHILEALLGERVKSGQEGITRLEEELRNAFGPITPGTVAAMEDELFHRMKL